MAYKRQHWLAKSYLKNFAIDPTVKSRNARVWKFDGEAHDHVRLENECSSFYFYTKANAKESEAGFQILEDDFIAFLQNGVKAEKLNRKEHFSLIFLMFVIHFRTAAYLNKTGMERIDAFNRTISTFLTSEIVGLEERDATLEEILQAFTRDWRLLLIKAIRAACDQSAT